MGKRADFLSSFHSFQKICDEVLWAFCPSSGEFDPLQNSIITAFYVLAFQCKGLRSFSLHTVDVIKDFLMI